MVKRIGLFLLFVVLLLGLVYSEDFPSVTTGGTSSVSITTLTGNATNFTQLLDVPSSYAGEGSNCVLVNAGETGLEFGSCSAVGDSFAGSNYSTFLTHVSLSQLLGFNYYNATTIGALPNTNNYWNNTFATFNKTYADTLYSTINEPKWTGNFTDYNSSWSLMLNTSYYLSTNPFAFYNATTLGAIPNTNNYWNTTFANFNKTYADTLYSAINEPLWTDNFTKYNNSWTSTYNATYNALNSTGYIKDWNATGYIRDWNASGLIKSWASASEVDPFWTGNFTAYNNSWTSTVNTSYYLVSNPYRYYNSTTPPRLDEIANPNTDKTFTMANNQIKFTFTAPITSDGGFEIEGIGAFNGDLFHLHQHTGNPSTGDLLHLESVDSDILPLRIIGSNITAINVTGGQIWANKNITSTEYFVGDGRFLTNLPAGTEVDPHWTSNQTAVYNETKWTGNYTLYNNSWTSTYNATYNALNSTGFIKDWNASGWIINWSQVISSGSGITLSDLLGFNYWNNTFATFNKTYADTLYCTINEPLWTANFTAYNNSWTSTYNSTYAGWNATGYIRDWNASGLIKDWSGATETDPKWTGNFTLYNTSWSMMTNTSYYLLSNPYSYLNTTINTSYYLVSNPYGYLNTTINTSYREVSNNTFTTNISIGNNYIINATESAFIRHNGTGWVIRG